jgi:hypothetical protein
MTILTAPPDAVATDAGATTVIPISTTGDGPEATASAGKTVIETCRLTGNVGGGPEAIAFACGRSIVISAKGGTFYTVIVKTTPSSKSMVNVPLELLLSSPKSM